MKFWKLTSAGNDFICIDNRSGVYNRFMNTPASRQHMARVLCERNKGVGADGIAVLSQTSTALQDNHFSSLSFEPDGSICELCGNSMASLASYTFRSGISEASKITFDTPAGMIAATKSDDQYIKITMPTTTAYEPGITLFHEGSPIDVDFIVAGIPHTATFVDDINQPDVDTTGAYIRHHERFQPRGVNANFVEVISVGELAVRTYEFGVEGETLACGTGSCACAVISALKYKWNGAISDGTQPVVVRTRSGEIIRVHMELDLVNHKSIKLFFEAPVRTVMQGEIATEWIEDTLI